MVSIGFEAVASLKRLNFTLKGVMPGKVHYSTFPCVRNCSPKPIYPVPKTDS